MAHSYPEVEAHAERLVVERLLAYEQYERRMHVRTSALLGLPVVLVLAMAVVNVAGLGVALAVRRQRDAAIRLSVGASPRRIVLERLGEGVMVAPLAGGVGVVAALGLLEVLGSAGIDRLPPIVASASLESGWTPVFVLSVSAATALASALLPAWSAGRTAPLVVLQGGDWTQRRSLKARTGLLVSQAAVVTLLAVVAAASARSLWRARTESPGFDTRGLSTTRLHPARIGYGKPAALELARRLLEDLNAEPRVQVATLSRLDPVRPTVLGRMTVLDAEDGTDRPLGHVRYDEVAPDYFEVLGIPLVAGRSFRWTGGREGVPEIVVSAAAARRWPWPRGRVVGSRVRVGSEGLPHTVVGVAGDVRSSVLAPPEPFVYVPLFQRTETSIFDDLGFAIHLRRFAGPRAAVHPVAAAARALDAELPIEAPPGMGELIAETLSFEAMLERLTSAAAAIALLIVSLGLYATASQIAAERAREFGVRLALGARPRDLACEVLRWCGTTVGGGLAVGLVLGAAVAPSIARTQRVFLSVDALVIAGVGALVLGVGLAAVGAPALRALRTDPAVTLRLPAEAG